MPKFDNTEVKTLTKPKKVKKASKEYNLILYNDDHNTFDHVIDSLIEVCQHDPVQAEQCTLIAHNKGKCSIKTGYMNDLKPIYYRLSQKDLTTEIK